MAQVSTDKDAQGACIIITPASGAQCISRNKCLV